MAAKRIIARLSPYDLVKSKGQCRKAPHGFQACKVVSYHVLYLSFEFLSNFGNSCTYREDSSNFKAAIAAVPSCEI